mmetsp:Transcript_8359/g.20058  ORF Transcript_8359/g.20058 Transcript_8359/m.20058 type:complete len:312 (+) Transcript_8359:3660-4595(+)
MAMSIGPPPSGSSPVHMCCSFVVRQRRETIREMLVQGATTPRTLRSSLPTGIKPPLALNSSISVSPTSRPPSTELRMRRVTSWRPRSHGAFAGAAGLPRPRDENIAETSIDPVASACSSLSRMCCRTRCLLGSSRARRPLIFWSVGVEHSGLPPPAAGALDGFGKAFSASALASRDDEGASLPLALAAGARDRELRLEEPGESFPIEADARRATSFSLERAASTPAMSSWLPPSPPESLRRALALPGGLMLAVDTGRGAGRDGGGSAAITTVPSRWRVIGRDGAPLRLAFGGPAALMTLSSPSPRALPVDR